jgi:hypothetical protein
MVRNFNADDKGKHVMTADGDMVGTIRRASGATAHVEPDSGLSESIRNRLGWEGSEDAYRLPKSRVDRIEGEEVYLRESF